MKNATQPNDVRIFELEKKLAGLESSSSQRNYGNRGSNPIGWRVPYVAYDLSWEEITLFSDFTLYPNMSVVPRGSEIDTCIKRQTTAETSFDSPGFYIVGKGTWIFNVWIKFHDLDWDPPSTVKLSHLRHPIHFEIEDDSTDITYITPGEHFDLKTWPQVPANSYYVPEYTVHFQTYFNVKGDITPATPLTIALKLSSPYSIVYDPIGITKTGTQPPVLAQCSFLKIDSDGLRNVQMDLFGLPGVEEETPPEVDPPGEETPPGGPTPP